MAGFTTVAKTSDIQPGTSKLVEAAGKRVALFNVDGQFYAIDDTCSHRGGPLSEGELNGEMITCPWHHATFDVKTGQATGPPAQKGVQTYKVQIEGTDLKVEFP
jgi:3-phenylpropionate/trans-cinnamate dioxygenase ferredoxin component